MLKYSVKNQIIERLDDFRVVADSKNYLTADFALSEEWNDNRVFASFSHITLDLAKEVEVVKGKCFVPWEVIKPPFFSVSLFCGDLITSNVICVPVEDSGLIDGEPAGIPSPTIWSKFITEEDLENKGYAKKTEIPAKTSELDNDSQFISFEEAPVQSVNGKSGIVQITAPDIGLGNVDNTSDNDKHVLSAEKDGEGNIISIACGYGISAEVDPQTYICTFNLLNANGDAISTSEIDLPLESMVVSGEYNADTKKVTLTLKSGNAIEFSIADLVSGLVSQTDIVNSLDSSDTTKPLSAAQGKKLNDIKPGLNVGNNGEIFNDYDNNTAEGLNSHAEGEDTHASGACSHAEGWSNSSPGPCAHSEGGKTVASSHCSHSEGYQTEASGERSHAEGWRTQASGQASHAEGYQSSATAQASHAEGWQTKAIGQAAHAEGWGSQASGSKSHAEGHGTKASGENSHAQGRYNIEDTANKYAHIVGNGRSDNARSNAHTLDWDGNAWFAGVVTIGSDKNALITEKKATSLYDNLSSQCNDLSSRLSSQSDIVNSKPGMKIHNSGEIFNDYTNNKAEGFHSHAEGYKTTASEQSSHAEGMGTVASQKFSHAEGYNTTASGEASHAEGRSTKATGIDSHSEGLTSVASGERSHAEGRETQASGWVSHAEGYQSYATNQVSHAEGWNTYAIGQASHAEGWNAHAEGGKSHAEGHGTTALGENSHAEGQGTKALGEASHVQGKYNIPDTEKKYAHIVGNGASDYERSNAHTLDWNGNAWFKGTIKVGGTSYDDGDEIVTKSVLEQAIKEYLSKLTAEELQNIADNNQEVT